VEAPDAVNETLPPGAIEAVAGVMTTVGAALTVAVPVAKYWVAAPLDVKVTFPLAPLVAVALRRTYIVVADTAPEAGVMDTEAAKPEEAERETS
jgi:hypothetical protein